MWCRCSPALAPLIPAKTGSTPGPNASGDAVEPWGFRFVDASRARGIGSCNQSGHSRTYPDGTFYQTFDVALYRISRSHSLDPSLGLFAVPDAPKIKFKQPVAPAGSVLSSTRQSVGACMPYVVMAYTFMPHTVMAYIEAIVWRLRAAAETDVEPHGQPVGLVRPERG